LAKPFGDEVLSNAIGNSIERSRTALGQEAKIREIRDSHASLSRRKRQVIALVVCGRLNKQVGGVLVIIVSPTWATAIRRCLLEISRLAGVLNPHLMAAHITRRPSLPASARHRAAPSYNGCESRLMA
jgi:hypothetical protein